MYITKKNVAKWLKKHGFRRQNKGLWCIPERYVFKLIIEGGEILFYFMKEGSLSFSFHCMVNNPAGTLWSFIRTPVHEKILDGQLKIAKAWIRTETRRGSV